MNLGLYYIRDEIGDVPATQLILAANRKVALLGFSEYLENQIKPKKLNPKNYKLCLVGVCDSETYEIVNTERKDVCNGDEVHSTLVDLGVLTEDIEEITDQPEAVNPSVVLDNGEI